MMESAFILGLNKVLSAGYVLSIAWINCTMYLIASFYRKNFSQSVPRTGFVISIGVSLLYIASLFFAVSPATGLWPIFNIIQQLCLVGSAAASGWSSINLLLIMKKPRK
jgi:hypothetical protein